MGKITCTVEYRDQDWATRTVLIDIDEVALSKGDAYAKTCAAIILSKHKYGINKVVTITHNHTQKE